MEILSRTMLIYLHFWARLDAAMRSKSKIFVESQPDAGHCPRTEENVCVGLLSWKNHTGLRFRVSEP